MGFYTQGLIVPSIVGFIVFACQVLNNKKRIANAVLVIFFPLVLIVLNRSIRKDARIRIPVVAIVGTTNRFMATKNKLRSN